MEAGAEGIARMLDELGLEARRGGEREWVVRVPCAKRGALGVLLTCNERTLGLRAFVLRGPDRGHTAVYARLLRKNLEAHPWRFALDDAGDVYLAAEASLEGLRTEELDGLLGALSTRVDETYEGVVRTGFDVPEGTAFAPPPGD
jgi:hypothetical protein